VGQLKLLIPMLQDLGEPALAAHVLAAASPAVPGIDESGLCHGRISEWVGA
jgi:hypothetical protein